MVDTKLAEGILGYISMGAAAELPLSEQICSVNEELNSMPASCVFKEQLEAVFLSGGRDLHQSQNSDAVIDLIPTDKKTDSGVSYMDIARALICNMQRDARCRITDQEHSQYIYEGLDNYPVIAYYLSDIFEK